MLRVAVFPSPMLGAAVMLAHAGAGACLLAYVPGWWGALSLTAVVASMGFHLGRTVLLRSPGAIVQVEVHQDGRTRLQLRSGTEILAKLVESTFVSKYLIILHLRCDDGRFRALNLMPDSAPEEELRQLRVWLRHGIRLGQS